MPSKAWKAFNDNLKDIDRLLELHAEKGGMGRGRRTGLEVLNKSAIVLITSFWEAYCEDIASEGLEVIVLKAKTSDVLPEAIKRLVAKELIKEKHELAIWTIADDKWRRLLKSRLDQLRDARNRKLNTPRSDDIDQLFHDALGLEGVSARWRWKRMPSTKARSRLDSYVSLRGAIAHRGQGTHRVRKYHVTDYRDIVRRIASKTGGAVSSHVRSVTGQRPW